MYYYGFGGIVTWVYILAAVLPAIVLMRYVYKKDSIEKESRGFLFKLFIFGGISGLIAGELNYIGESILAGFISQDSPLYTIIMPFVVVGVVEEGCKFFFLKKKTWNSYEFNYRFDGIVYAAYVSLGFAALENITYVFNYGLSVALPRAFLSVPGHFGFSVFMGAFYGRAKLCEAEGYSTECHQNLIKAYIIAVLLHGFYDACAMTDSAITSILFWVFVILMYIVVIRTINKEVVSDTPIDDNNTFRFI